MNYEYRMFTLYIIYLGKQAFWNLNFGRLILKSALDGWKNNLKLISMGIEINGGTSNISTPYFDYEGVQLFYFSFLFFLIPPYRSLFLFVVVNNRVLEEGNKLQNWCDILIVVTKYSSDMKLLLFDYF